MAKESITVVQFNNPKFDSSKEVHEHNNPEYKYKVERTVNTLRVVIFQTLTPMEIQALINSEINVTVVPVK